MDFEYIVLDKEGRRTKSSMKAVTAADVAVALRDSGGKPLKITQKKTKKGSNLFQKFLQGRKHVTSNELVIFTRQLGTVLNAGVLLTDAINTISVEMENKYFEGVLEDIVFDINAGENFSKVLAKHPLVFSSYYVAIVSAGEAVGRLGQCIADLATFMEEDEKMRQKFLMAIRYPVFLICFVFCIVSGIVLFLIPKFKAIFDGAGIQLPLLTRIVVGISEFSLHYFLFMVLGIIAMILVTWQALKIFKIRFMVDYMQLRVWVIGKVMRKAFNARFCQTLSMLLSGGVGIIPALSLSGDVMENYFLKGVIEEIRQNVMAGSSLSEAMSPHLDLPRIMVKMVAVGEKAGKLSQMLKRVGDYYDQEVAIFLNNINSILEPVFIIIIGGVVLVVALALYLPIFEMSSVVH